MGEPLSRGPAPFISVYCQVLLHHTCEMSYHSLWCLLGNRSVMISCPQSAMLNAADLVFVGNASIVFAYLVITAERYSESFTMCLWMELFGGNVLPAIAVVVLTYMYYRMVPFP